jgi:hypothetical protein
MLLDGFLPALLLFVHCAAVLKEKEGAHTKVSDAFNVSQESDYNLADGGGKCRPQSTHPLAAVSLPFKN